MTELYRDSGYIADPHGAVGYLGLKQYLSDHQDYSGIFLETAHPIKFIDVVEETLGVKMPIPPQISAIMDKEKIAIGIDSYGELKQFLLG